MCSSGRRGRRNTGTGCARPFPTWNLCSKRQFRSQGSLDDPKNKIQVMNAVLPYLAKLPNAVERSDYVFRFARKLGIEDQQLLAEVKRAAQQKRTRLAEAPLASIGAMKFAEKRLLQVLLSNTDLQQQILPLCSEQDFEGLATEKIFAVIMEEYPQRAGFALSKPSPSRLPAKHEQALLAQLEIEEVPERPPGKPLRVFSTLCVA